MLPGASSPERPIPLSVDLDGTLIKTDVLWESLILLCKGKPWQLLLVPLWLLRGRAFFKAQVAARVELNAATLPYHEAFMEYLRAERRGGRDVILATAADQRLAQCVANHVGLFSSVMASNGEFNLRGKNKGKRLAELFGRHGFDYAGNSTVDLPVWAEARRAIVVNGSAGLVERARKQGEVSLVFDSPPADLHVALTVLRPHQWVKNLIVFAPLLTSHNLGNPACLRAAFAAFAAFCLCASGIHVLNDLLGLEASRLDSATPRPPFASGQLPLPIGLAAFPILLGLGLGFALALSWTFVGLLVIYMALIARHPSRLKEAWLAGVFCLAGLYTLPLIAGRMAASLPFSFRLPIFFMLVFLSLAIVKRFGELRTARR